MSSKKKDVQRYRWLRSNSYHAHIQVTQPDGSQPYVYAEELDKIVDLHLLASTKTDFNQGIKNHDGRCMAADQKLLVKHILDTDEGLSENSRKILEELIK